MLGDEGFTYVKGVHEWGMGAVSVFMRAVRLTCRGRTGRIDDEFNHQAPGDSEAVFLKPHPAIRRLLKQRARDLVCEALDAVEVLGMLTTSD